MYATSSTYWLLGDTFLTGYYSIHDNNDHANAKIGFAPNNNSNKPDITVATVDPKYKAADLEWERTWLFDVYWAFQLNDLVGVWGLDNYWFYEILGDSWAFIFGPGNIVTS